MEVCHFQRFFNCEPHGERKETYLCPSTDWYGFDCFQVRFGLVVSTVWIGSKYSFVILVDENWEQGRGVTDRGLTALKVLRDFQGFSEVLREI